MTDSSAGGSSEAYKQFRFDKFEPETEKWDYYLQRFELELEMHGLMTVDTANLLRNLLLSKVGPYVFKILADHFKPIKLTAKSYKELIDVLNRFYGKKVYVFAERVNFAGSFRKENEAITDYVNRLRASAGDCGFGDGLDGRMRDQLIFGINNRGWQEKIIQKHPSIDTTLEDVEATAVILEQASIQAGQLTFLQPDAHVNRVSRHSAVPKVNKTFKFPKADNQNFSSNEQKTVVRELYANEDCLFCGGSRHRRKSCPAFGKTCSGCGENNHFYRVCVISGNAIIKQTANMTNQNKQKRSTRCVREEQDEDDNISEAEGVSESDTDNEVAIRNVRKVGGSSRVMLSTVINGRDLDMLFDPGSVHAVVGKTVWRQIGKPKLTECADLIAYGDKPIRTLGKTSVDVSAFKKTLNLQIYVTKENDIPLFGLDWCLAFNVPLPTGAKILHVKSDDVREKNLMGEEEVSENNTVNKLLEEFGHVFEESLGTIRGHYAKIHIQDNITPKRFRPRNVPLALQDQVAAELQRLVKEGVLEPVDTTNQSISWASPIVVVMKSNGKVRLCADFKVTINRFVQMDDYPLPRFEDITAKLSGGKYFSKIDLKDAYLQMEVHPESRKYLVVATHKGYFAYKRLPFGISFAPALFQRTMDQILSGIDGVVCYLDDILITAPNMMLHLRRLREVLRRLQAAGIRTQRSKCDWLMNGVTYLGHRIDDKGLHPTENHVEAIRNMPIPQNTTQLRSFLGAITYYGRFIENLHVKCVPLHRLLKKNAKWEWTEEDTHVFHELKRSLTSSETLVHYDPDKPLVVSSDASGVGAGAVLSHGFPDGTLKPVAFASRSFSDVESRYSTIDKEALGLVYAVTKFHQYLYGRRFTLITDHKPLERIFGEDRQTPKIASNRLLRWAMTLNSYDFEIIYRPGKENGPADSLSRLPLPVSVDSCNVPLHSRLLHLRVGKLPVRRQELKKETERDAVMSNVIRCLRSYWPNKKDVPLDLLPFYEKRDELSFEEGVLLWNGRVCVPTLLRERVLGMLHDGHPGTSAMLSLARLHVYWPKLDVDINYEVDKCLSCQESRKNGHSSSLPPWGVSSEPWSRLHLDFAGPFEGKMWLVLVDSYSRWLEIVPMKTVTSIKTIEVLRSIFARFGLPKFLVTDNGPQLVSSEFEEFCNMNGITHVRVTPYHPKSNGLAERAVRTFKERMRASSQTLTQNVRLQSFLFSYRNTERRSTKRTPSQLMFGRHLRSRFDLLKPDITKNMEMEQMTQKRNHDRGAIGQNFEKGEAVWVNNPLDKGCKPGVVEEQTGPLSYVVNMDGVTRRKHCEQLRRRMEVDCPAEIEKPIMNLPHVTEGLLSDDLVDMNQDIEKTHELPGLLNAFERGSEIIRSDQPAEGSAPVTPRRNPARNRRLPERYRL
nr:uncharacterized protein K02A2.6-like [Onthophagus taurus]